MTNPARAKWMALRVASLAVVLGVGAAGPSAVGDDGGAGAGGGGGAGGCPSGAKPYFAAGQWKGTFKLVYQSIVPGVPEGIKTTSTWEGEMSFEVARPEKDDPPPPEKPDNRRRPLAPPLKEGEKPPVVERPDRAAPGQFANDAEQRAAILAWYAEQGRKDEEAAQERAKRYGTQIPPAGGSVQKPTVRGGGKGKISVSLSGVPMPGTSADASARNTGEASYELKAVEEDADLPIKRIEVWGDRREVGLAYDIKVTGRDGSGASSGSVPKGPGEKILLTYFEVEDLQCGVLSGHIDATAVREHTRKKLPGYDIRVSVNTWTAKRDDRDESLEQRVDALVNQPIPAALSWGYLDEFTNQAGELRKSVQKQDDYSRCVLKALEGKFVKIARAFIKELGKNFPNAELEPSCEVLRQAVLPLYDLQRSIELYGAGGCPEVAEAWGSVEKQLQRRIKFLLQGSPSFQQLACFKSLYAAGLLGDMAETYNDALRTAELADRTK